MSRLDHALAYAKLGWPVLLLKPDRKDPATSKGFKDATTDAAIIRQAFTAHASANIGIHTGPANILVLDVDTKKGQQGPAELATLESKHGVLPTTLRQKTPSGAYHLFFKIPEGLEIGNTKLSSGIDVRCSNGYVGVAPSRCFVDSDGYGSYEFEGWDVLSGVAPEMADAPQWLLDKLTVAASAKPKDRAQMTPQMGVPTEALPALFDLDGASAEQLTDLRSALAALDADPYDSWISNGMRLKPLGDPGKELWLRWSKTSSKFDQTNAEQTWRSLKPDHTGFKAVFAAAQAVGWINPAASATRHVDDSMSRQDRTDAGNVNFLAMLTAGNLRYVPEFKIWLGWDGERWTADPFGYLAQQEALRVAEEYLKEARNLGKMLNDANLSVLEVRRLEKVIKSIHDWVSKCRGRHALDNMLALTRNDSRFFLSAEKLDRNPWLFGVDNGVVDLQTGALRAAGRDEFTTKRSPVPFDPNAQAPRFLKFIEEITATPAPGTAMGYTPRPELADYLQRMLGYCLTGRTVEHKMFIAVGGGSNGKSILLDLLKWIASDYVQTIPPEALMASKGTADAERATPLNRKLAGCRLALSSESKDGQRLDVALVKRHTGDGYMTARGLHESPFTFEITHKLVLLTNSRPGVDELDDAMRGRLHLIPFDMQWNRPGHPSPKPGIPAGDPNLADKLKNEATGVLAWLVTGAELYSIYGLHPPKVVTDMTTTYFDESDPLTQWLAEVEICMPSDGGTATSLYSDFTNWCKGEGASYGSQKRFSTGLLNRNVPNKKTKNGRMYGIRTSDFDSVI